jgi:ATP-dependent Lon protease
MFTSLASLLTGGRCATTSPMTGEISLRGLVLPIGGVKEKVLAALRAGITTVMLPARNRRDLEEIPADARAQLEFVWVEDVDQAIRVALEPRRRQPSRPDAAAVARFQGRFRGRGHADQVAEFVATFQQDSLATLPLAANTR